MSSVRVRFAPSPTGFFHIGSARTALFNWLYAQQTSGTFILRIEDTDRARNTPEALKVLIEGMKWLGMNWNEGPEVGGPYAPYFQSERDTVYQKYLERLKSTGRVYEKEGALWFKISGEMQTIHDVIRGDVQRQEEKDFVIIRSDGTPVFHFVNVVDDIDMKITHVIRGEDHLSNTSKHVELFKAFGAPVPTFAHIPLILKTDGPGKMSKRDRGALIEEYQKRFYLPEALVNYLSLLGWSPKDDREILSVADIVSCFDLHGVNKNNARFDEKKLSFVNSQHLRLLPSEKFCAIAESVLSRTGHSEYLKDKAYLKDVLSITQEKLRSFEELPDFISYFFDENFPVDTEALAKIQKKQPAIRLKEFLEKIHAESNFSAENLESIIKALSETHTVPTGDYIHALRLAISGRSVGPSLYRMLAVIGKEKTQHRIQKFCKIS